MVEEQDRDQIIELVVLEQFIIQLLTGMVGWVQCHRPASLDEAVQMAEDHMVVDPGPAPPPPPHSLMSSPVPSLSTQDFSKAQAKCQAFPG